MDLNGATILLTGGTGSFGNAFVERVLRTCPDAIVRDLLARRAQAVRDAGALRRPPACATSSATSATAAA